MATFDKGYGMTLPSGTKRSEELAGPSACRAITKEATGANTFFSLNSIIDWPSSSYGASVVMALNSTIDRLFNSKLRDVMVANPSYRVTNTSGRDISLHGQYMYALPGGGDEGVVDKDVRRHDEGGVERRASTR